MNETLLGWIAVLGAVISFGSFAVPIKFPSVQAANVHPYVFQTYKSFWVFTTAWLALTFSEFSFTWWGCVSAMFWVPSGAAYVMAVDRIGIGITQAIVSSLVITVSVIWGLLFFNEPIHDYLLAVSAFVLLTGGVSTMAYYSVPSSTQLDQIAVNHDDEESQRQSSPLHENEDNVGDENLVSPLLDNEPHSLHFDAIRVSYAQFDQVEYLNSDGQWENAVISHVGRDEDFVPFYTITLNASGIEKGTVIERLRPLPLDNQETVNDVDHISVDVKHPIIVFEKYQDVEYQNKDGLWEAARVEAVSFDEDLIPFYTIALYSNGIEKGTVHERLRSRVIGNNTEVSLHHHMDSINSDENDSKNGKQKKSIWVGVAAACFNGLWGGSVMVPLKIANRSGAKTGGIDFVLSFGIGVCLITTLGWIIFAIYSKLYERPLPSLQLSVLVIPGSIAGILWSIGNFSSMYAVIALGEAVGYSSCQAAVMVSGLWGLFYFGEAPRGKVQWLLGACATTGGIVLLSNVAG